MKRSEKLVADSVEEDRRATWEELSWATGAKASRTMHKHRPQLLVVGQLILYDNARPHIADVVTKNLAIMGGKCYLMATQYRNESIIPPLISKVRFCLYSNDGHTLKQVSSTFWVRGPIYIFHIILRAAVIADYKIVMVILNIIIGIWAAHQVT